MCTSATLAACGGGDPATDAKAVCDCQIKANSLKADDPNRAAEQKKCMDMQMEKWNKYKGDAEKAKVWNETISECGKEVLQKSMESMKN